MPFTTKLIFEDDGGFPFTLVQPLTYYNATFPTTVIPTGFKTDLASIPRVIQNILPPVGLYDAAAVVHDFLYQTAPRGIDRGTADRVLLDAMDELGVSRATRWTIYLGVRSGGWMTWNRYRDAQGTKQ